MALQKNKIYRAEITGYTAEGASVARIEGIAVFIPGGAVVFQTPDRTCLPLCRQMRRLLFPAYCL